MNSAIQITQEVRALEALNLGDLRAEWRRRWGPPPTLRAVELLRRLMAWRIQAEACGGLDAETRRLLRHAGARPRATLQAGARFHREWQGRHHEVVVGEGGFEWSGQTYRSLSEVARAITGTRWNGPRFFGLRQVEQP